MLLQAGNAVFRITIVLKIRSRLTSDAVTRVRAVTCGLQHKRGTRSWQSCEMHNEKYELLVFRARIIMHVAVGACLFN